MNVYLSEAELDLIAENVADRLADRFAPDAGWLNVRQASEAWGISKRAVYGRAERGRVEKRKEGRSLLVRRS